jgi:hypothetical protein
VKDKKDKVFYQRFGSLFSEFKNNKGFFSTLYYTIFYLRRLVYLITQVYLNSALFIQSGINVAFSFIQTFYLLYYRPFKEKDLLVSSTIGDMSVSIVLLLSTFFIADISAELSYVLETVIIYIVIWSMGIQFIVSLYSMFKSVRALLRKILKYRKLQFVSAFNNLNRTVRTETISQETTSPIYFGSFNFKAPDSTEGHETLESKIV